ncbi:hypothetical protein THASP1DRAFT_20430, partial [Thamnocephalis sphaerospora]
MCALSPVDPNSFGNVHEIQTRHLHLDLSVDFGRQVLLGSAQLTLQAVKNDVAQVVLDTRALRVLKATLVGHAEPLTVCMHFLLAEEDEKFGSALRIVLPRSLQQDEKIDVKIEYETTHDSGALQWLQPKQTVGKQHP